MFCARCGTPITGSGPACPECGLDLFQAGAIRLTDPKDAQHWREDRALVVRPPDRVVPPVIGRSEPDAPTVVAPVVGAPLAGASGAVGQSLPDAHDSPGTPSAVDASDLGGADAVESFPVDYDDSRNESSVFVLGGEDRDDPNWLPWVVVTMIGLVFVAVIGVTVVLLNLANRDAAEPATSPTPSATTSRPAPSKSATATRTPTPSPSTPKVRPTFPANARTCSATLAVSTNASCGLAESAADALAKDPTATRITATSPISGREFRFECVADTMTICKVGNVTVYLIAD